MNIWEVYNYNNTLLNKEQSGRSFTAEQFNEVAPFALYEFIKQKGGLPENYQIGAALSPQMWQASQVITDALEQLLTWMGGPDYPLLAMDQYGVADKPTDYLAFSSCYFNEWVEDEKDCTKGEYKPRTLEFIPDALWPDRLASPVNKPTFKYPVAKWAGGKIQFAPVSMRMVNFTYLRKPKTPFLAVTIDENNDYVYDAANSVQFDVPDLFVPDVAAIIRQYQAGNIQSQLYIQLAEQRKQRGI